MDALADTCFFIDLQRGTNGAATWLATNPSWRLGLSVVTYAELAVGSSDQLALDERLAAIPLLPIDQQCAWIAGQIARTLRGKGRMIGANDIWIASTALQAGVPLVTRNLDEFSRISGLKVVAY